MSRMRRIAKALLWKWRRRHAAERIRLQRLILGSSDMIGIDVGAAEGLQPHWWAFEGIARMYLFEPHEDSANKLRDLYASSPYAGMFHVMPVGLGAATGVRDFYVLNAPTGSSLYPIDPSSEFAGPDNRYVHPIRTTKVQVRRLSEVLDEQRVPRVDIAKLDVQGAELEVLHGLDADRLASLVLVEAEVNISGGITKTTSPYVGVPTWAMLDEFLLSRGMRLARFEASPAIIAQKAATAIGISAKSSMPTSIVQEFPRLRGKPMSSTFATIATLIGRDDTSALRRLVVALCAAIDSSARRFLRLSKPRTRGSSRRRMRGRFMARYEIGTD